jgi:hypothetical protein
VHVASQRVPNIIAVSNIWHPPNQCLRHPNLEDLTLLSSFARIKCGIALLWSLVSYSSSPIGLRRRHVFFLFVDPASYDPVASSSRAAFSSHSGEVGYVCAPTVWHVHMKRLNRWGARGNLTLNDDMEEEDDDGPSTADAALAQTHKKSNQVLLLQMLKGQWMYCCAAALASVLRRLLLRLEDSTCCRRRGRTTANGKSRTATAMRGPS